MRLLALHAPGPAARRDDHTLLQAPLQGPGGTERDQPIARGREGGAGDAGRVVLDAVQRLLGARVQTCTPLSQPAASTRSPSGVKATSISQ